MIRDGTIRWLKVGAWARRYYALQLPAGRRVEVVNIVTSGTCLDGPGGALLYSQVTEFGLLFGELCEVPGEKSLLSPGQGLRWMMMEWLVVLRLVIVVVIVVVIIVVV